ncbi:polymer-forming cytoskeletal protein [Hyalangium minutum]|nr:polymer-forming cytoskeletal protein [Hyalangium minutum]
MSLPSLALATFLALPALAEDSGKAAAPAPKQASQRKEDSAPKVRCEVHSKNGSRAVQGQDLILNSGEQAKDAVAVDGNVVIRKGAVVGDVVAIRGRVIIEEGAVVKGDAVALGGELHLRKNARVKGDAMALGGTLQLDEGASVDGDRVNFSLGFNGEDLAQSFLKKALENSDCSITVSGDDDDDDDHDEDEDA